MTTDTEVRIKLPLEIHQKWSNAATVRGLSLKGFIAATVSGELIRTGELNVVAAVATNTPPLVAGSKPKANPKPYDPFSNLPDPRKVAEMFDAGHINFLNSDEDSATLDSIAKREALLADWPEDEDEY